MSVVVVVEGDTDEPFARKLLSDAGLEVSQVYDMGGKAALDTRLIDFNNAAKGRPWVVFRDLDHDADCAPAFVQGLKLPQARWMVLRLAVREVESWAMADCKGLAMFMGVEPSWVPGVPDAEDDPTARLVELARRSPKKRIQKAFVPRHGDTVAVGPGYESELVDFAQNHWDPRRACRRSPSLASARNALQRLSMQWARFVEGK